MTKKVEEATVGETLIALTLIIVGALGILCRRLLP
jgi:hypothetical protein